MSTSPDAIRADIEETRRELGGDVDALADKVTPSKIMDRQKGRVKDAIGSVKDRIMGVADDAGSGLHDAGAGIGDAKDRVVAKAQGNPLAVGLVAFGVGLVVASLIPASEKEKDVAANVQDGAQPLVEKAKDVAKEVGEHLKEPAQQAATAVKDTATDAAQTIKAETKDAAAEVKGKAQQARENVSGS
ncbi:MAG TPA: DUF3618 domain-containing protein [Microbacterium sp.]|uniref:DUF3618 domain-containing protein n=1 Tax=Microbacterium sp. TaxID=51671 RepID=UPI002BB1F79F|nr:DUF3618 domain-containing protein [Microbacterium sp.]HWI31031.1 DUF3618 domain-containing protein [Microbacterium sp.]